MDEQWLAESRRPQWTRADDYVAAMARKRSARRGRSERLQTGRDAPRIVPFLVMIILLGILVVAIMVLAFPGSQPQHKPKPPDRHELGTATRGWFQEAQKQFR
jgi:tetrahydromethanopterin S-methyltransferase subunit F